MDQNEIVTQQYAQQLIMKLQKFELYQLGTKDFFEQHRSLQKLNFQAHQNYAYNQDEWISETLNNNGKWDVLIYNLIVCQNFRTKYMPKIKELFLKVDIELQQKASIFLYSIMYHEAVIVDLLSVRIVDQLPQTKYLQELVDYVSLLLNYALTMKFDTQKNDKDMENFENEMAYSENDLLFKMVITGISLVRGISCAKTDLTTQHQLKTHRWHVKVAQILTQNPHFYERKLKSTNQLQYYEDNEWKTYQKESERFFKIYKNQGQLLISLLGLSMINDDYSRNEVMVFDALKGQFNNSLVDQLPQLNELRLFYEKLCFNKLQTQQDTELENYQKKVQEQFGIVDMPRRGDGIVVIDVVSSLYAQMENYVIRYVEQHYEEKLKKEREKRLDNDQQSSQKSIEVKTDSSGAIALTGTAAMPVQVTEADVVNYIVKEFDYKIQMFNLQMQTLETDYDKVFPLCHVCQKAAQYRCSKCKRVWYCGRQCQVNDWKEHKQICQKLQQQTADIKPSGQIQTQQPQPTQMDNDIQDVINAFVMNKERGFQ